MPYLVPEHHGGLDNEVTDGAVGPVVDIRAADTHTEMEDVTRVQAIIIRSPVHAEEDLARPRPGDVLILQTDVPRLVEDGCQVV